MRLRASRPESVHVFIVAPPWGRDGADEMERRLKNAGKRVCNPFALLDRVCAMGVFASGLEDIEEVLVKQVRRCDAICLVDGWEQHDLCRRLRDVAIKEDKMSVKLRGFYR